MTNKPISEAIHSPVVAQVISGHPIFNEALLLASSSITWEAPTSFSETTSIFLGIYFF